MKINVNCKGSQCPAEAPVDEASATGKLKGRKNINDALNRGYLFEALDLAHDAIEESLKEVNEADDTLKDCQDQLKKLDELRDSLNEIGAAALRADITALYSPEHARWAERDKMLKDALKILYDVFGDLDAGREMVVTYTSSLATNAKKALLQNKNAIEVTKQDLEDNGLTGDSEELVTFTKAKDRQANATMAKELAPIIDQAKVVAEAAGANAEATVPASEYKKLLDKLTEMYENASKVTKVISTTVDFKPAEIIKKLKTAPEESKLDEGFIDKLVDMFKKLASGLTNAFASLKEAFTSLFGEVEEANDTYAKTAEILMTMGFAYVGDSEDTDEAKKKEDPALKDLGLKACENRLKKAFVKLERYLGPDNCVDELFFAQEALEGARTAMGNLKEALESLRAVIPDQKNEDNMEVIGILADAIAKITADEEGETEEPEGSEVIDQVSREYSGSEEPEEPAAEEPEGEEPAV